MLWFRRVATSLVALLSVTTLSAQTAEVWLDALKRDLGERYTMAIEVDMSGTAEPLKGLFMVDGDSYYITLGAMEVYGDGELRYEVNNERKEATIDRVDLTSHDLLTNPTKAFSFASEEFAITLHSETNDGVVINLKPNADMGISNIELRLKRDQSGRVLPLMVEYGYDGEVVKISLALRTNSDAPLPRWDKSAYRAYDIVSFI